MTVQPPVSGSYDDLSDVKGPVEGVISKDPDWGLMSNPYRLSILGH